MKKLDISHQDIVLLIPALNPGSHLVKLIDELAPVWNRPIVIVDDGSSQTSRDVVFPILRAMGCDVISHAVNLGKGRALKYGFNYILGAYPEALGAVTADADGQHAIPDIIACAEALASSPEPLPLVLGCRDFNDPKVPRKSMLGNKITRSFMRIMNGVKVTDTQTGLRAIPREFMKYLMNVPGERFEFETNMLIAARESSTRIAEVPIQTVYIEDNRSTHFDPFRDSVRIYLVLLKACRKKLLAAAGAIAAVIAAVRLIMRFAGKK